jgi:SAM-dependent methyltransferase
MPRNAQSGAPAAPSNVVRLAPDTAVEEPSGPARCRACRAELEQVVVDLGSTPLANSYLRPSELDLAEPFYPLCPRVCHHCWLVQLPPVAAPEDLFRDYAYFSSYSTSWLRHAERYVEAVVDRFALDRRHRVVEIASNDGYLLQYLRDRGIPVLGVEPAENVAAAARARGIETVNRFFGSETAAELAAVRGRADLIVANNVLAHTPHLVDFVAGIHALLAPGGVATLEFPHLVRLVAGNQFDTIYHEHFSYFSFTTVRRIFAAQELDVFDVEELTTHGGSLRIYVQPAARSADRPIGPRVLDLLRHEHELGVETPDYYSAFAARVAATKRRLLEVLIAAKDRGEAIVGYGAPAKGNTLLNYCGIGRDFLDYTVDASPHKQGLFLPGTRLPIYPPARIAETRPDLILLLPWNLRAELVEALSAVRGWGGRLMVPIPDVEVL